MKRGTEATLSEHFRRTDPRYDRQLQVEIIVDERAIPAQTRNISLGGMLVLCDHRLSVKLPVRVRFRVPTQGDAIEVTGEVRWAENNPGGQNQAGIRFNGLRAREVWALNRFFQS